MNKLTKYILIGLGIVLLIGLGAAISVSAKHEIKECTHGEKRYAKCEEPTSTDYGESRQSGFCNQDGKWMSTELVPGWCTPENRPPICNEGETQCISPYTLEECKNGNWQIIETNSTQCGYKPPCSISQLSSANFLYPTFYVVDNITNIPIQGAKILISTMVDTQFIDVEIMTDISGVAEYKESGRMLDATISTEGYITCIYETCIGNLPTCAQYMCPRFTIRLNK